MAHLEQNHGIDMLFSSAIKATMRILNHRNIAACIVGELAFNYYNVPGVVHVRLKLCGDLSLVEGDQLIHALQDVEICVPDQIVDDASLTLTETGLFENNSYSDIHAHNEYKFRFLRLITTDWLARPVSFVIFPASFCGLQPLDTHAFRPVDYTLSASEFSKEIPDSIHKEDLRN